MSARVRQAALVLGVAVLTGACGHTVAAIPRSGRATVPTARPEKATTTQTVPLVLETGVPPHPPRVELAARRGGRQIVQPGVEFTHDWTIGAVKDAVARDYPVPWPRVSDIGRDDDVTVTLDTPIVPDWVVVKAYVKLVTADLIPEAIPTALGGCVRLAEPRCNFERTASGIRITGLGNSIVGAPYVVVFCMWHVPLAMQKAKTSPRYEVAASWLFHVDSAPQPEGAQP